MLQAYDAPAMTELRLDGPATLRDMLITVLAGCLHRWPAESPVGDQPDRLPTCTTSPQEARDG